MKSCSCSHFELISENNGLLHIAFFPDLYSSDVDNKVYLAAQYSCIVISVTGLPVLFLTSLIRLEELLINIQKRGKAPRSGALIGKNVVLYYTKDYTCQR
jgi:hypothetical protein